jgi:hypothetical protein
MSLRADEDSDPEFNSGIFIPEPKRKKGRKRDTVDSPRSPSKSGKRKRKSDFYDDIVRKRSKSKARSGADQKSLGISPPHFIADAVLNDVYTLLLLDLDSEDKNPLLQWFGASILHSR